MRLADIANERQTIRIDIGGATLTATVNPAAITPASIARLAAQERAADPMILPELLAEVLVEWDLTDDDGRPYPIEVEALGRLPMRFLARLGAELRGAVGVDPTNAAT